MERSSASICAGQKSEVENSNPTKVANLQASNRCSGYFSYESDRLRVQEYGTDGPQQHEGDGQDKDQDLEPLPKDHPDQYA
jgi:hypothetical protein